MAFVNWEEPTGTSVFSATGKDIQMTVEGGDKRELAYWMFANKLDERLPQGGTLAEVYHQVAVPFGLSLDDTKEMLQKGIKAGYVKRSRGG